MGILERAVAKAEELPNAQIDFPFGPEWEAHRVKGKIFMLVATLPHTGQAALLLKLDPDDAVELRAKYPSITPGYHMNKKHWNTLVEGSDVDEALAVALVKESYRQVVAGLPKKIRPVDPATFDSGLRA